MSHATNTDIGAEVVCVCDGESRQSQPSSLKFHQVDEQWQRNICAMMGLHFHGKNRIRPGGPNVPLTPPDRRTVKHILYQWRWQLPFLFPSIHTLDQHMAVRTVILQHMIGIAHFILDHHAVCYILVFNNILHNITWTGS